jgi:HD-GYP domain-containing protein (c-di-GMP phosphodiesterase class II)
MTNLNIHEDLLKSLNHSDSLNQKLRVIHDVMRKYFEFINRIAIALYDDQSQILKTFLASSGKSNPLIHYESKIHEAPSLQEIIKNRQPRVVNDLGIFDFGEHEHTIKIKNEGFNASYTLPIFYNDKFLGFVFFNSKQKNCFTDDVLNLLDLFGHLVISVIMNEMNAIKTMLAALRTANEMVHYKDPETGSHLERMAHFSRLIAKELSLSKKFTFDDEFIEDIFNFSPMHDVGKIGIPDKVLRKPAKLDNSELNTMKTHASKGRLVIDSIIHNFQFENISHVDVLRNIAEYHHETLNGSGYPHGLKEKDIPIEARIIAVADIFDALTSERPYKRAWSNEMAFETLEKMAKNILDRDCVNALLKHRKEVAEIQNTFKD